MKLGSNLERVIFSPKKDRCADFCCVDPGCADFVFILILDMLILFLVYGNYW